MIDPPRSTHALTISPAHSSARSASPGLRGVVQHERVQVAVARVEDVGDAHVVLLGQLLDARQHLGQLGARDHAVLHVVVGREPAHRGERRLARLPDQRALGLVLGDADAGRLVLLADLDDLVEARRSHSSSGPSSSITSAAPASVGKPAPVAPSAASIESLSMISIAPGMSPAATIVGDRAAGVLHVLVEGDERAPRGRVRDDAQRDLGGDAERALGADERAEQVVAGSVDALAAAQVARRRRRAARPRSAGHVVGREAVLEAVRAAGVLGDVAADRADDLATTGRAGSSASARPRAPTSTFVTPGSTTMRWLSRSTSRIARIRVSTISTPSLCGSAPPDRPRAGAARDDRHARLVTGAYDRALHLLRAGRKDCGTRQLRVLQQPVRLVGLELVRWVMRALAADRFAGR